MTGLVSDFAFIVIYSRTSVAGTLMARLPQLFRTHFLVPWEKIQ